LKCLLKILHHKDTTGNRGNCVIMSRDEKNFYGVKGEMEFCFAKEISGKSKLKIIGNSLGEIMEMDCGIGEREILFEIF